MTLTDLQKGSLRSGLFSLDQVIDPDTGLPYVPPTPPAGFQSPMVAVGDLIVGSPGGDTLKFSTLTSWLPGTTNEVVIHTFSVPVDKGDVTILINFWSSQFRPGGAKDVTYRIRRGVLTNGEILLSHAWTQGGGDNGSGHSDQWNPAPLVDTPTDGKYCLTFQVSDSSNRIYSNSSDIEFNPADSGPGTPAKLSVGSPGTTLVPDSSAGNGLSFSGVKTGSGAPSGAPDGFLPLYLDTGTFNLYVWDGAAWRGPYAHS